jgi:glycosyltransferase involved in cell wall biosynthesis
MVQFDRLSPGSRVSRWKLLNYYERRQLFRRKYARVPTHFVANSQHTLEFYRRVLPSRMRPDVHLIPYGFSFARFERPAERKSDGPRRPGRPLRIVNVGSFQEKKNQALAVAAAHELKRALGAVELDLIGDGPTRPRVEALVHRLGLENSVRFRGNVDDVEQWLWASDVYLHTAWYEPFGLVFLEAMAAGLPVVALDGKGNRSLIRHEFNGLLIEDQRPEAFGSAILRVFRDFSLRERLVANGTAVAREYDIRSRAQAFVDLYRRILPS